MVIEGEDDSAVEAGDRETVAAAIAVRAPPHGGRRKCPFICRLRIGGC